MATEQELARAEFDLLTERSVRLAVAAGMIQEGEWTGSMGGHDPDFEKLKAGLKVWAVKMVASNAHPFRAMVAALRDKFPKPERLVAWLIDQVKESTDWRKGKMKESALDNYLPTIYELRTVSDILAHMEACELSETAVQEAATQAEREVVQIDFSPQGRIARYDDGSTEAV